MIAAAAAAAAAASLSSILILVGGWVAALGMFILIKVSNINIIPNNQLIAAAVVVVVELSTTYINCAMISCFNCSKARGGGG